MQQWRVNAGVAATGVASAVLVAYCVWLDVSSPVQAQVWPPLLVAALLHFVVCVLLSATGKGLAAAWWLWAVGVFFVCAAVTLFAWPSVAAQCVLLAVWPILLVTNKRAV
jgi:hypothetical protein